MLPRVNIGVFKALAVLVCLGMIGFTGLARAQSPDEDHQPSIRGIKIGMTAADVLDRLGRMPDGRKDEKEEAHLIWKLEEGNLLQVTFRGEHVSQIALQYKNPRPTTDLWLLPLASKPTETKLNPEERSAAENVGIMAGRSASTLTARTTPEQQQQQDRPAAERGHPTTTGPGTEAPTITARDPRWRQDYKPTETYDKLRIAWTRQEKVNAGYHVEIRFLSSSRKQFGDRFGEFIEFKYVTVLKEDLKKFDQGFPAAKTR